ncbi:TPA: hypothetical protein HL460_06060 [Escherichia coli]|nr:lysis system o-spanin lipoprotein Rz1 [Escherichia coli]HAJ0479102.1 hypothetical protein [Escherichia coli]
MLTRLSKVFVLMFLLVVSGCTSKQSVRTCIKSPPPPAWMMAPAPDLLTPLNGIISSSEIESQSTTK